MKKIFIYLLFVPLFFLYSCKTFYPNRLFIQKDYQFFELQQKAIEEYTIQPGDELTLKVYSRDGFKLIDIMAGYASDIAGSTTGQSQQESQANTYTVDVEGFAKLPVLGNFFVKGYTKSELEKTLEERYATLFINPYIIIDVKNSRAFVFKGSEGSVVPLNKYPTSLIEVLAASGGLGPDLKAYNIKLMRGDLKNPQVTLIDLSTLEGMRKAQLTVQSNDIVYIEARKKTIDLVREITPIFSIVSTVISLVFIANRLGK